MYYVAHITQDGTTWLAEFPDAPGCQTEADTLEALPATAQEALEGWLEAHLVDGLAPPKPSLVLPEGSKYLDALRVPVPPSLAASLAVRWARQDRGLSQAALASLVGVSQQQIAKIENPDENPTLKTISTVARALGMEVHLTFEAATA